MKGDALDGGLAGLVGLLETKLDESAKVRRSKDRGTRDNWPEWKLVLAALAIGIGSHRSSRLDHRRRDDPQTATSPPRSTSLSVGGFWAQVQLPALREERTREIGLPNS